MKNTENLTAGQIVKSLAGHDKGDIFFVVEVIDTDYVLIADGDKRKIESPKKKKAKHLQPYKKISKSIASKIAAKSQIENIELQRELEKNGAMLLALDDQREQ